MSAGSTRAGKKTTPRSKAAQPSPREPGRIGRPEKDPGEVRDIVAGIRLTVAEREQVRELALQANLTLSEFLRMRLLNKPVIVRQGGGGSGGGGDPRLIHELNAIGVNLNQIARNLNAGRRGTHASVDQLDELMGRLSATLVRVMEDFAA